MGTRIFGDALFGLGDDPSLLANNNPSAPVVSAPAQDADEYRGGTVTVTVTASDTQETVARKAAYAHARSAGLSHDESLAFAESWMARNRPADGKTYLYHLNGGNLQGYTDEEFAAVKQSGVWEDQLNPALHYRAISDINLRLWTERNPPPDLPVDEADVIRVDANPNDVAASQEGIDNAAQLRAEVESMPLQANVDAGARRDGKPFDADTALGRYVQQTYNGDGRVWGDKINEVVSLAKLRGVRVENLQVGEDGRATFELSAADKQTLDRLFAEALGETIRGEEAAERARQETQAALLDFYQIQANGVINVVNDATKLVGAPEIPKFDIESEYWNKEGRKEVGEATTTITAALLTGKLAAAGRAINVGDTAASTTEAIVGEDLRTGEELSTTQRVFQGVTGAATTPQAARDATEFVDEFRRRVTDARLRFPDLPSPQLATANGAPLTTLPDAPSTVGSNVLESRAYPQFSGLQLPVSKGRWVDPDNPGNSGWVSEKPAVNTITGGEPVPFKDGFVDFSKWSRGHVTLETVTGINTKDFPEADRLFAQQQGWLKRNGEPNAAEAERYRVNNKLTWHHVPNSNRLELIPRELHGNVPHTGSASQNRLSGGGNQ